MRIWGSNYVPVFFFFFSLYVDATHRQGNPQTDALLAMLELEHRVTIPWKGMNGTTIHAITKFSTAPAFLTEEQQQLDPNEIPLDGQVPDEVCILLD